jgi:hypothetical protein
MVDLPGFGWHSLCAKVLTERHRHHFSSTIIIIFSSSSRNFHWAFIALQGFPLISTTFGAEFKCSILLKN